MIIVHDVRDEETRKELTELIMKVNNPAIELVEGVFGSPGAARNFGFQQTSGEWICFWDSDDIPNVHTALLSCQNQSENVDVVVGAYVIRNTNLAEISEMPRATNSPLEIATDPGIWRMIFKSASISGLRFNHFRMAEDQLFLLDLNIPRRSIVFTKEILYTYIVGQPTQATKNYDSIRDIEKSLRVISSKMKSYSGVQSTIAWIMFINQALTGFKHLRAGSKLRIVSLLFDALLKNGIRNPKSLLDAGKLVFKAKVSIR